MRSFFTTLRLIWNYWFQATQTQGSTLPEHLVFKRNQQENFRHRGVIFQEQASQRKAAHAECTHRKGGRQYFESGHLQTATGNDRDYSVIKHRFPWGDTWVICTRCNKKWKPGMSDYEEALKFPTNNSSSASITFQGPNVIKEARELTKES